MGHQDTAYDASYGPPWHKWGRMVSSGITGDAQKRLRIGPSDIETAPAFPPDPDTTGTDCDADPPIRVEGVSIAGWTLDLVFAVAKYDVADGSKFQGPPLPPG